MCKQSPMNRVGAVQVSAFPAQGYVTPVNQVPMTALGYGR